jgi:hypothetical protein
MVDAGVTMTGRALILGLADRLDVNQATRQHFRHMRHILARGVKLGAKMLATAMMPRPVRKR